MTNRAPTASTALFSSFTNRKWYAINYFALPGMDLAYKRNQFGGTVWRPDQKEQDVLFLRL